MMPRNIEFQPRSDQILMGEVAEEILSESDKRAEESRFDPTLIRYCKPHGNNETGVCLFSQSVLLAFSDTDNKRRRLIGS